MFEGKVIIVTGAGGAIGRAAAMAFAAEGASVTLSDLNEVSAKETVDAITELGGIAQAVIGDVSKAEFAEFLVTETIKKFGGLDSAFNNAGIVDPNDYTWDESAFRRTFEVNLLSTMLGMKFQIPEMLKRGGGTIVNTSSVTGLISQSDPPLPAYTSTKHAIIGLTKTAALQYARQNIRVNAVCPGVTRTAMVEQVMKASPEVRERLLNYAPMGRMAEPAEIAEAVIWLCSKKASFVTGHSLVVDGGFVAQ
jgi:NAD(P)-dependent dehydrogenase (short-subunit alcohol dehydrogenase family)